MKLVVGLGNPGELYENTRHNFGFMAIDNYIAGKYSMNSKGKYQYAKENIAGETVIFMKPLTFMNLSGQAVREVMDFYKITISDIIVIYDDLDSNFGKIKIKKNSSSGGHNGIKDIINHLGSQDFLRIKLGINNEYKKDVKKFVLSKFSKEEMEQMIDIFVIVNNIIDDYLRTDDYLNLMNKYN